MEKTVLLIPVYSVLVLQVKGGGGVGEKCKVRLNSACVELGDDLIKLALVPHNVARSITMVLVRTILVMLQIASNSMGMNI